MINPSRNPIMSDPEVVSRFEALPDDAKLALRDFLTWLYYHAREEAQRSWKLSKAPMAVYWKAVAAWAWHLRKVVR